MGGGLGSGLGVLCGVINIAQGESYERTLSCVCWTAYHPRSPFYWLGLGFAIFTIVSGSLGLVKWKLPPFGPLQLFRDAAWAIWGLSVITLFYGDQYWLGAFVGVAAAMVLDRTSRPLKIAVPLAIVFVLIGLTVARVLRVPGIP